MQQIGLAFLVALGVVGGAAQSVSEDTLKDIVIVKQHWRLELRDPVLEEDPLAPATAQGDRGQLRSAAIRNPRTDRDATVNDGAHVRGDGRSPTARYVYEVTLRNTGIRTITSLRLEYVFRDISTGLEVGRISLSSTLRLGAGRARTLTFYSASPPTGKLDARSASARRKETYLESIEIREIGYAGSKAAHHSRTRS